MSVIPLRPDDGFGNKLWADKDGKVHLHLKGGKTKHIGTLVTTLTGRTIYHKAINMSKHMYEKTTSIGFCWEVLERLGDDDQLAVYDRESKKTYVIPVGVAKDKDMEPKAHYLHHKDQGFERQWFVPLSRFTIT